MVLMLLKINLKMGILSFAYSTGISIFMKMLPMETTWLCLTHPTSGFNLLQLFKVKFTIAATVLESQNNSYTCKYTVVKVIN